MSRIAVEHPDQPDIAALIDELDAFQKPLYPLESHHGIDIAELLRSNVRFAVARDDDGRAIGCGAVVFHDGYGELKRMFVHAPHRGQGIARQLLMFLENEAAGRGCPRLMLETGISQPGALGLYENAGYARCEPFGNYADDPFSVFMQRTLG